MRLIELEEWGRGRVTKLTNAEASIASHYSDAMKLEPRGVGRYKVTPAGGWVGTVNLSNDTQVIIRTKVPLESFFALTALAYEADSLPTVDRYSGLAAGDPSDWLTLILLSSIERLVRYAIRRGYVDAEEHTAFVRGRIVFGDQRSLTMALPLCRYADFTINTIENRALKSALSWIASRPARRRFRIKASQLLDSLTEVDDVPLNSFALDQIEFNRLNGHYGPTVELIRLLQQSTGFEFAPGNLRGPGMFFPMHKIFEKAVYTALKNLTKDGYVIYQPTLTRLVRLLAGNPDRTPVMRPDIAISGRPTAFVGNQSHTKLIVDAKYKIPLKQTQFRLSFRSEDIYQIMAYSSALSCRAVLVYPKLDEDVDVQYSIGDRIFRIVTVDLSDKTLTGFERTLHAIAAYAA